MGEKLVFLLLAILAAVCMAGVGISVGYRSIVGMILCLIGLTIVMGYGFSKKRKLREEGKL